MFKPATSFTSDKYTVITAAEKAAARSLIEECDLGLADKMELVKIYKKAIAGCSLARGLLRQKARASARLPVCSICYCPIVKTGVNVHPGGAAHVFHRACIDKCKKRDSRCPLCRVEMVNAEPTSALLFNIALNKLTDPLVSHNSKLTAMLNAFEQLVIEEGFDSARVRDARADFEEKKATVKSSLYQAALQYEYILCQRLFCP